MKKFFTTLIAMSVSMMLTSCAVYVLPHYEVCNAIDYTPFQKKGIEVSPYSCDRNDVRYIGTLSMYISSSGAVSVAEVNSNGDLIDRSKYKIESGKSVTSERHTIGRYTYFKPSYTYLTEQFAQYVSEYDQKIDAIYDFEITYDMSVATKYSASSITGYKIKCTAVKYNTGK